MKILILGGTGFIGSHIVELCVTRGYKVSVLSRGETADKLPPQVERLFGDRSAGQAGLDALRNGCWDVCFDLSGYTPLQIRASSEVLRGKVNHYIYFSSIKALDASADHPLTENDPLHPSVDETMTEIDNRTYGLLKASCERIVKEYFPAALSILRPQVVVGPQDLSGRLVYWILKSQERIRVLAPGDGVDFLQVVDVQDVAGFSVTLAEIQLFDTFNLSGEKLIWSDFLELLGIEDYVWVASEYLENAGISFRELPLFRSRYGSESRYMNVSNEKAVRSGLTLMPFESTLAKVKAWMQNSDRDQIMLPCIQEELLSAEQEARLIEGFLGSTFLN